MTITTFDDARQAVADGLDPVTAARALLATMTEYERLWCLDGDAPTWAGLKFLTHDEGYHRMPFFAGQIDRLGIPGIRFADGPRGAAIGNAPCFPVAMARGATWDPELEEQVGDAIGRELKALGANLTGAVCVNLLRHPAWGRAQETYGEDPCHVGAMGAAVTRGLQRHVMATMKHFACNSMENARFTVDVEVDDVALHEVYLPHFKRIADEGIAAVMSAYNSVNGEWCGESHQLLTSVLRDEWGFEGIVISDWILGLRDAATSLRHGLDIEMPYRMVRAQHLPAALERGDASWDDVDRSVLRLLSTLLRFDAVLSAPPPDRSVVGSARHRDLARHVAARSTVLLRNEPVDGTPVLPLAAGQRVAVIGALAGVVNVGDGGSSDVWDVDCHSVVDGLRDVLADVDVDDGSDLDRATRLAASADVVLVVVGYTYLDEGEYIGETDSSLMGLFPPGDEPDVLDLYAGQLEQLPAFDKPTHLRGRTRGFSTGGDRTSLRLSDADVALIRAVAAANPRTIVSVQSGGAVIMTEWVEHVPAVVQSWFGGCRAGQGLADVVTGAVNPSARLPFSVPRHEDDLPPFDRSATHAVYDRWHGWWRLERDGSVPLFPFGFGLSYTDFALDDVSASVEAHQVVVTGMLHNIGQRDGADVVQVYAAAPTSGGPSRLIGFARVEVAAGGSASFDITVPFESLQTRDPETRSWIAPTGTYRLTVGRHATDPHPRRLTVELPSQQASSQQASPQQASQQPRHEHGDGAP